MSLRTYAGGGALVGCIGRRTYHGLSLPGLGLLLMSLCSGPLLAGAIVKLAWDANTGTDLAGYRIYYGTASGSYTLPTIDVTTLGSSPAYTVPNLTPNTTYYFVVKAFDQAGNESLPSNEVAAQPAVTIGPLLTVSMTDAPDPIAAGGTLTYTLTYANTGDTDATGVIITDSVPANTSFTSATAGGTLSSGVVTWSLGTVAAKASGTVLLTVKVNSPLVNGTTLTNGTYNIDCNENAAVAGTPVNTTVTSAPVLTISKTASSAQVTAGGTLTYTITCRNSGNANTTGVVVTDPLPANTSFVSATAGGILSGGVVTWSVGALNVGSSASKQLVVRVTSPLAVGTAVTNANYQIDSNESGPTTGAPVTATVVAALAPTVTSAVEAGTNSIYILQSGSQTVLVFGTNFQNGATVSLGSGITAGATTFVDATELTAPITVSATASPGGRTLTVTNPDGGTGSKVSALTVVKTADINRDCKIDLFDLNALARAWLTSSSDSAYNPAADLDGDGLIDGDDLAILTEYMGQSLAVCP